MPEKARSYDACKEISGAEIIRLGTMQGEHLLRAAGKGDVQTVKEILSLPLQKGGPKWLRLTARDQEGNNALHLAVSRDNRKIASYLLEEGLWRGWKNDNGKTPSDLAIEKGFQDIADLIQKYKYPSHEIGPMQYEYTYVKYYDYIKAYQAENWLCDVACHNPACGYKSRFHGGMSHLQPDSGFFIPALCEKCKQVVRTPPEEDYRLCGVCGGRVKLYPPYSARDKSPRVTCPSCGEETLEFEPNCGNWD